jgi:4'-phosphopantetheinyl transferase
MQPSHENRREYDQAHCPTLVDWHGSWDAAGLGPSETRAWIVDLDAGVASADVDAAEPGPEIDLLSDDERTRAARFIRARDRRRFVCCRATLRSILGGLLGQAPGAIRFRSGGQGKPELDSEGTVADSTFALRFNVSHSSELAIIGVCRGREVGIDIERVRAITEADRIVASYFTLTEQAEFATLAGAAKAEAFFRGWTRKEAILKGLGIGLSGLAAELETGFGACRLGDRFEPATPSPRVDQWNLWEAAPRAGFVATFAINVSPTATPTTP